MIRSFQRGERGSSAPVSRRKCSPGISSTRAGNLPSDGKGWPEQRRRRGPHRRFIGPRWIFRSPDEKVKQHHAPLHIYIALHSEARRTMNGYLLLNISMLLPLSIRPESPARKSKISAISSGVMPALRCGAACCSISVSTAPGLTAQTRIL